MSPSAGEREEDVLMQGSEVKSCGHQLQTTNGPKQESAPGKSSSSSNRVHKLSYGSFEAVGLMSLT